MTSQRRGRRPGHLVDPTPPDGAAFHAEMRIGWLLRSWRLAVEPESSARSFAASLCEIGVTADASRVSRWETGHLAAPLDVVSGYERALGVSCGSLAAVTVSTRRVPGAVQTSGLGLSERQFSVSKLETALDEVVDGAPTGADWFRFAVLVASRPEQVTLAMSTWRRLTSALVGELGRSVSTAYVTRAEAAKLLATHPRAKQALVQSIGAYVMSPDSMLVIDPLTMLTEMDDPPASDLVLRLLEQTPPGPVLNGAAWAASTKVTRGHFDGPQLDRLERVVVRLLRDGQEAGGLFHRLADLVAVLPAEVRARIGRETGQDRPELPRRDVAPSWDRRQVAQACELLIEADEHDDDPMLERLVDEAVFHGNAERRFQAALLLTFSPHRARLGATAAQLVRAHVHGSETMGPLLAERLMLLLTFVGTEAEREMVHEVIASGPHHLLAPALIAAAHLPPSPVRPDVAHIVAGAGEAAMPAMYCAGMTGHPCLAKLAHDDALPEWAKRAATWWHREGPAIHEP